MSVVPDGVLALVWNADSTRALWLFYGVLAYGNCSIVNLNRLAQVLKLVLIVELVVPEALREAATLSNPAGIAFGLRPAEDTPSCTGKEVEGSECSKFPTSNICRRLPLPNCSMRQHKQNFAVCEAHRHTEKRPRGSCEWHTKLIW